MTKAKYDRAQLEDLVLQMMETELGGEKIYRAAIATAVNDDLKEEWEGYLQETLHHQEVVRGLCTALGLSPDDQSPTRTVIAHIGKSLVQAIEIAQRTAPPHAAQVVAAECVVLAETKDHSNWELLGRVAEVATRRPRQSSESCARRRRAGRRPPPVSHQRLDARAGDSRVGHAGRAAAARRG